MQVYICISLSLITSQIDTAPKLVLLAAGEPVGLITSQIDTAPKPRSTTRLESPSLITSQIDTAPKQQLKEFHRFHV